MLTYFDLIKDEYYRNYISGRIAVIDSLKADAINSAKIPTLYKYSPLSTYAIDNILKGKITLSSIGEFNDVYDGAMHQYGTREEIIKAAEKRWIEMENIRNACNLPADIFRKEDIVNPYIEHFKKESRLRFRILEYLGTYVCCMSEVNSSVLMWSHYADSNRGICIKYEFNNLPSYNLLRNSIFPIIYTKEPIDVSDLMDDKKNEICKYSIDVAALCSAINKAQIWDYEMEWRIVWIISFADKSERRITLDIPISPSKVYLGYHFLRSFFYFDDKDKYENCKKSLIEYMNLLEFLKNNGIPIALMMPIVGAYGFIDYDIPINNMLMFMRKHFRDEEPQSIRYYHVIHDYLKDMVERLE